MGLRPLALSDLGFESRLQHGYLSVVGVVCCQVEILASGRSLVQSCPTKCGVSLCVIRCNYKSVHLHTVGTEEVRLRNREPN